MKMKKVLAIILKSLAIIFSLKTCFAIDNDIIKVNDKYLNKQGIVRVTGHWKQTHLNQDSDQAFEWMQNNDRDALTSFCNENEACDALVKAVRKAFDDKIWVQDKYNTYRWKANVMLEEACKTVVFMFGGNRARAKAPTACKAVTLVIDFMEEYATSSLYKLVTFYPNN